MARFLLAWELGAGLGHLVKLRAVATELRRRGHDCVFAVRHLDETRGFLDPALGPVLQAPLRLSPPRRLGRQHSYAGLLADTCYAQPRALAARLAAWRGLMQLLECKAVVADHAPTALLAARSLNLPRACIGTDFTLPPLAHPFPPYRAEDAAAAAQQEIAVLAALNAALVELGLPPVPHVQAIFEDAEPALMSYPELDTYAGPRAQAYLGLPPLAAGAKPQWPDGSGPKIFAYLRPYAHLPALLQALAALPARVLVRLAGAPAAAVRPGAGAAMQVTNAELDIAAAAHDCDAYVGYGAHALACEMLLAGKPGLLLPFHFEQFATAQRIVALSAGLLLLPGKEAALPQALARLTGDAALRAGAEAFARRYTAQDRSAIIPALVERLLARPPPAAS